MDLSLHMTDLYIEGPDAYRLIADFGANSFRGFGAGKAKQYIACAPNGYLIGDMILFGLSDRLVNIVGRPTVASWLDYNAQSGKYNVRVEWDQRTVDNQNRRRTFRYQIQGPHAWQLIEKLNGKPLAKLRLFQTSVICIAGHEYRFLRHGMGGAPGGESRARRSRGSRSRPPSWRQARNSESGKLVVAHMDPASWTLDGFRVLFRQSIPAHRCRPTASGCRRRAMRALPR